ncbi:MAG: GNAT family N-acetyltransferase [Eubacteriales bacterium]|nr:GNAT family N-acetyltransferase [Eubacteriales bacterium]
MQIRKAKEEDIEEIMKIVKQAKAYFIKNKVKQWLGEYPNEEGFKLDIKNGNSYVLENDGKILATFYINIGEDENYKEIYEGKWLYEGLYGAIHRVAILEEEKGKGIAAKIVNFCEEYCKEKGVNSLRIDTHRSNKSMLRCIEKNGFEKCGIIYEKFGDIYSQDTERIAFEKILN